MLHGRTLQLELDAAAPEAIATLKALASGPRLSILQSLASHGLTISELAEALGLPASTTAAHIKILESAGLVETELRAAAHGLEKVCTRVYDNVLTALPRAAEQEHFVEVAMPVGAYTAFAVEPTCGLASPGNLIGFLDEPLSFWEPERVGAALIWFRSGYVEYTFPNRLPVGATLEAIQLSTEICSEAPLHNTAWPSDITLWVEGREIGTWTCPSDFGGRRGAYTPTWWGTQDSQYGLLKRWQITPRGSQLDGHLLSAVTLDELGLDGRRTIAVRLGVKADALHVGGINIFGRGFGNYPQDLVMRLEYRPGRRQ